MPTERSLQAEPIASPPRGGTSATGLLLEHFALISSLVPEGARVLDLGCGDGELLSLLHEGNGAEVQGVEPDPALAAECRKRGIAVVRADLDQGLASLPKHSFDVVILSQALQTVRRPVLILRHMFRVGGRGIVSFTNPGRSRVLGYLALRGWMPQGQPSGRAPGDTSDIRLATLKDVRQFVTENGGVVERELLLSSSGSGGRGKDRSAPDLLGDSAVFVVHAASQDRAPLAHTETPSCCGYSPDAEKAKYSPSSGA
jgi:methionine biosynthesis protein MetW